jgi:hypothetical protein
MKKVLVTTTETLQGWEIVNYIEPIYSNLMVGQITLAIKEPRLLTSLVDAQHDMKKEFSYLTNKLWKF